MPLTIASWIGFALKILLPFVSSTYLFTRILAHVVCLSGQRTSKDSDDIVTCRFALQNNEGVSLNSHQTMTIRVLDEGGRFENDHPVTLYAGCNKVRAALDPGGKVWTMTFSELPAYDTWTIECKLTREARNIEVTLNEEGSSLLRSPVLSHDKLVLTPDKKSVFVGHRSTPEPWWVVVATALAIGAYSIPVVGFELNLKNWTRLDSAAELSILLFATLLYFVTRTDSAPIIQGYWQATVPEPITVAGQGAGGSVSS